MGSIVGDSYIEHLTPHQQGVCCNARESVRGFRPSTRCNVELSNAGIVYAFLQAVTKEKHEFVSKIFIKSGISMTRTAVPAAVQPTLSDEPRQDLNAAQDECKMVYGQVITNVLKKTGEHAPRYPRGCTSSSFLP